MHFSASHIRHEPSNIELKPGNRDGEGVGLTTLTRVASLLSVFPHPAKMRYGTKDAFTAPFR